MELDIMTNCVTKSTRTRKTKSKNVQFAVAKPDTAAAPSTSVGIKRPHGNDDKDKNAVAMETDESEAKKIKESSLQPPPPEEQRRFSTRLNVNKNKEDPQTHARRFPGKSLATEIKSSIFTKNPEIPQMKKTTSKDINEEIFSEKNFADLNLHPYMVSNLRQSFNIERLTAVQENVIPLILEGKDVLVKSQTGSGKTLSYAVPIIQHLQAMEPRIKRDSGIFAIVIVPTRELAVQTFEWFHTLLKSFTRIVVACFMGGQKRKSEKASIRRGINVLVTTPQRFLDHFQNSSQLSVSNVKYVVLDEADRLTDMGYERDIKRIVDTLKQEIRTESEDATLQVAMLSATLTAGVERLAGLSLVSPARVDCAIETFGTDLPNQLVTPSNLRQHFVVVPVKLRLVTLASFILWKCKGDQHKLLVFMPTQDMVDYHAKLFAHIVADKEEADPESDAANVDITQLHGDMSQKERTEVFKEFRTAKAGVLLCTDVASRGLDLPQVHWIIQYNAPTSAEEYVHRVGRTARIGLEGNGLLFLLPSESAYVQYLDKKKIILTQMTMESILGALPRIQSLRRRKRNAKGKLQSVVQSTEEAATSLQLLCEKTVKEEPELHEASRKAFQSYVRFYATYPGLLKYIFQFKELHLGHLAKSMGLLERPTQLGTFRKQMPKPMSSNLHFKDNDDEKTSERKGQLSFRSNLKPNFKPKKTQQIPTPKKLMLLEYASGL